MAKYYYNKYTKVVSNVYKEGAEVFQGKHGAMEVDGSESYSFNPSTGVYTATGPLRTVGWDAYGEAYGTSGTSLLRYEAIRYGVNVYKRSAVIESSTTSRGALVQSNIIAENGTYPANGVHTDGYWYVKGALANATPTIDGVDSNLGDKNTGFSVLYKVNDTNAADNLIVTEKLNESIIKTINGAPRDQLLEIEITNETLFSLPLDSENVIEIKVDDQKGGIAYRRYTFRRTNSAPLISGQDEDLGQKLEPFSMDFSISDVELNLITVKTYLNGIKKEEYQAEDSATNTFTISREDWYRLGIGQHSIKIEAIDEHGATAIRNYIFTRYDDKIQFTLKAPIETDIMATKILVTPTWVIPEGAVATVEACNNAYDEVPTWEDITSQVLISRHYNFTNTVKTAAKWGINIRFTIEKGTATEQCIINGFGGAFE